MRQITHASLFSGIGGAEIAAIIKRGWRKVRSSQSGYENSIIEALKKTKWISSLFEEVRFVFYSYFCLNL